MSDVFDPPAGDESLLNAAASLLGTVATDLGSDLTTTTNGVTAAVSDWRGTRSDDFTRAGAGAQVQLKLAQSGCETVAGLLGQYARAFASATSDVAEYSRLAGQAQSDAEAAARNMDPDSTQYDMAFQHVGRQVGMYQSWASGAKADLARTATRIAGQIDEQTDRVAPVSSHLTADQIRRQVDSELGLTGLTGPPAGSLSSADAWAYVVGAQRAVPSDAVNVDGTVDWSTAFERPSPPPVGTSPAQVNAWWVGLAPNEQNDLLNHDGATVGNLDGVPIVDRDFANRIVLPALIAKWKAELAALGPSPSTPYRGPGYAGRYNVSPSSIQPYLTWKTQHDAIQGMINGLTAVSTTVSGEHNPQRYLVGVRDVGPNGRAIVASGNPDTATNVSTYVPGLGTTLTGIDGGVRRSDRMVQSALFAGADSAAGVTWFGYDAPQGLGAAKSLDDATHAAPLLDNFQTGLRFTHLGAPSVNTVVGHSYGTTVVGMSASHGNTLDANNVVFVASPGVTVDHVTDLHLTGVPTSQDPDHVYATVAEYDPIRLASGINGGDPNLSDFGDKVVHSDADQGHWYTLGWNIHAHSDYWNPQTASLKNLGLIIAGYGNLAK